MDLLSFKPPKISRSCLNSAASNGHLNMIEWLYANRPEFGATTSLNCHHDADHFCPDNAILATSAMDLAAASGHLDIVRVLHNHQELCSSRAMDLAAAYGNLHIIQWLHEHRTEGCSTNAMDMAASNGHLEIVQWLNENRTEGCTESAVDEAAANGHMQVVCWLLENRSEGFTDDGVYDAAVNGHCEILVTLAAACPDFESTFMCTLRAVDEGHFEIAGWMEQFGSGHMKRFLPDLFRERAAELLSAYDSESNLKALVANREVEDIDAVN